MKPTLSHILNFGAGALLTLFLVVQFGFREDRHKAANDELKNEAKWVPPALPEQMSFAGEAVPLDRWDVQERFDREEYNDTTAHTSMGQDETQSEDAVEGTP